MGDGFEPEKSEEEVVGDDPFEQMVVLLKETNWILKTILFTLWIIISLIIVLR